MPISDDVLLVHGDCFDVMPKIPEGSVDMVFCDLPYGISSCHWDKTIDLRQLWAHLGKMLKSKGNAVFCGTQPFSSALITSQKKLFRYEIIWIKSKATGHLQSPFRPLRAHENILIFGQGASVYNPQMRQGFAATGQVIKRIMTSSSNAYGRQVKDCKPYTYTDKRHPLSTLAIPNEKRAAIKHPTQKPVALLEWLIKTYTNAGDLVLDPCSGSGTTAIAALNTGRRAICIEKDPTYHAAAVKRLAEARQAPAQSALPLLAKNS